MTRSCAFARFMARPAGRLLRVGAGLSLIALGWRRGDTVGTALVLGGLVPLGAGAFNVCMLAPIIGAPFAGRDALDAPHEARLHG